MSNETEIACMWCGRLVSIEDAVEFGDRPFCTERCARSYFFGEDYVASLETAGIWTSDLPVDKGGSGEADTGC